MFSATDQSGKMPSDSRSPAMNATGAETWVRRDRCPAVAKILSSNSVWPCPESPASPMISPSRATSSTPSCCRSGRARTRIGAALRRGAAASTSLFSCRAEAPMAATSLSRSKADARSFATTWPSRMTMRRSHVPSTSPRRCEMKIQLAPAATMRRTKERSWPAVCELSEEVGSSRMMSLGGISVTVKARATSTIWRFPIGRSRTASAMPIPWPGKMSSSRARISSPARRRHPGPFSEAWLMRAFSATLRLGQSDSSWKTVRMPRRWLKVTA